MELTEKFILQYPEFKQFLTNEDNVQILKSIFNRVKCFFNEYAFVETDDDCPKVTFFMLVAHFLTMGGYVKDIGIEANAGVISSSSIDGVSVSFQQAPYGKDNFNYELSLTKYGREYLFYLSTHKGVQYIN